MKKLLLKIIPAFLSAALLSSCAYTTFELAEDDIHIGELTSEAAAENSETENTVLTETDGEIPAETGNTAVNAEKQAAVPEALEGKWYEWANTAADTIYGFLKENRYLANRPGMSEFYFTDVNFDDIPEIILFDGGQWGGDLDACTLDGELLYSYSSTIENESYIAAVDRETGEKVMLFDGVGGHGFTGYHMVFALTDKIIEFREDWQYDYDDDRNYYLVGESFSVYEWNSDAGFGMLSKWDDEVKAELERSDNSEELYKKYFGRYEELYRFDAPERSYIKVPDEENYTRDDVYACVSQKMKEYSLMFENPTESETEKNSVEKDGSYTTPEDVAEYIHTFGTLPKNFITKAEAKELGWDSSKGNLWDVAPDMSIGGDYFGNYEGILPAEKGRKYTECDVNYSGGYRGSERVIFSNDGLIFYTDDHYETFTQLY